MSQNLIFAKFSYQVSGSIPSNGPHHQLDSPQISYLSYTILLNRCNLKRENKKRNHIFLVIKDKTDTPSPLLFSCILNLNPRSLITKSFDVKLRDVLLRKMLFLFCLNNFLITSYREDSLSSFSFPCSTRQCTIHQSINKKPHDKTRQGTPLIEHCGLFLLFSCLNAKTHSVLDIFTTGSSNRPFHQFPPLLISPPCPPCCPPSYRKDFASHQPRCHLINYYVII